MRDGGVSGATGRQPEGSPIRILHVAYVMHRGGVETLLTNIIRYANRTRFRFDIVVRTRVPGEYDAELRRMQTRVLCCPTAGSPIRFASRLFRLLRAEGPYDVVHSHLHVLDGLVMGIAAVAGIPMRISHSHNTADGFPDTAGWRALRKLMRLANNLFATHRFAVSCSSFAAQFGGKPLRNSSDGILLNGIDLQRFQAPSEVCRARLRRELRIASSARVLGNVGRFHPQKNHRFLLESFALLQRSERNVHLVLVGKGETQEEIRSFAGALGLSARIHFLGARPDVPEIMGALDLFVLPSLYEGFGIVLVEAQACGVPCLVSDVVPPEADARLGLITQLPLSSGTKTWADKMRDLLNRPHALQKAECVAAVRRAGYDIAAVAGQWESTYHSGIRQLRSRGKGI